ncbi:MAG: hypothetical protein PF569_00750 [Candidatus Woesearchaeota archaeon]|jgi:hypothetical protein|nr:hypothetical protein [Candidatus Woesearchaeota archaeon]
MGKIKKVSNLEFLDLFKVFFSTKVFEDKKISLKFLIGVFFTVQFILGIISILKNLIPNYSLYSNSFKFFSVFLAWSIIYLILFTLFYLFLNTFEDNRKLYFESFFVSMMLLLPFVLIGSLFDYIGLLSLNPLVLIVASSFFLVLGIYFIVMFLLNFKNYYKTTFSRVFTSLILMISLVMILFLFATVSTTLLLMNI